MKKLLSFLVTSFFLISSLSAKSLVVYFSCTGNTERLAKNCAEIIGADIYRIVPEVGYTAEDLNWNNPNSRTMIESRDQKIRPAIASKKDISSYDTIVLAYPIWWGMAPKIIYTFIESNDLNGKKIIPVCTSNSSDISNSVIALKKRVSKKVKFYDGKRFTAYSTSEEVKNFLEKTLLNK